jgi:hypothetical protein
MSMDESSKNQRKMKHPFSHEEDMIIINFVNENGISNFSELNSILPTRTVRQIRERYRNYLDPKVNLDSFSNEEDLKLKELVLIFGQKWSMFTSMFNGRTDVHLKNHFKKLTRNEAKTAPKISKKEIQQIQIIPKREQYVQLNENKLFNPIEQKPRKNQLFEEKDSTSQFTDDNTAFQISFDHWKDVIDDFENMLKSDSQSFGLENSFDWQFHE